MTFLWQGHICCPILLYVENQALLEGSCMTSEDMQWPFYSSERIMAHGPLVLFLHENICCGHSFEEALQGASNEYPQHMFSWRNKKNIDSFLLEKHLVWSFVQMFLISTPNICFYAEKKNIDLDVPLIWSCVRCCCCFFMPLPFKEWWKGHIVLSLSVRPSISRSVSIHIQC